MYISWLFGVKDGGEFNSIDIEIGQKEKKRWWCFLFKKIIFDNKFNSLFVRHLWSYLTAIDDDDDAQMSTQQSLDFLIWHSRVRFQTQTRYVEGFRVGKTLRGSLKHELLFDGLFAVTVGQWESGDAQMWDWKERSCLLSSDVVFRVATDGPTITEALQEVSQSFGHLGWLLFQDHATTVSELNVKWARNDDLVPFKFRDIRGDLPWQKLIWMDPIFRWYQPRHLHVASDRPLHSIHCT